MDTKTAVHLFLPITLALIMLALGLGLTLADFKRIFEKPRAVVLGMSSQLIVLPVAGFVCAYLFSLPPQMAVGMVLVTACPGGVHSNLYSNLARGDTALSVTLTALSGFVTIFSLPLVTNLAMATFAGESQLVELPVIETMQEIFLLTGAPVVVGMLIRARAPTIARYAESVVKGVAIFALLVIIVGAVAKQSDQVIAFAGDVGLAVVVLNVGAMLLGAGIARGGQLPLQQTLTITVEVGIQNSFLAFTVAMKMLDSTAMAVPAIIYSLLVYFTGAVVIVIGRRAFNAGRIPEASSLSAPIHQ